MAWPWFGPIANTSTSITLGPPPEGFDEDDFVAAQEFNISLGRVNWLGNIMSCIYILAAVLTPWLVSRYNLRRAVRHTGSTRLPCKVNL